VKHLIGFDLVYFIQAEMPEGLIKIGATSNFPARFSGLVGGSPCPLNLLGIQLTERAGVLERKLHAKFASAREHGEWFFPDPALLAYVAQHTTNSERVSVKVESRTATANEIDVLLEKLDLKPLANISQISSACNISVQTIRRHVRERNIPFVRVGRQLRFDMREFFKGRQMDAKRLAIIDGKVAGRNDLPTERIRSGFIKVTDTPTDEVDMRARENT
jgi:excisionase family DNA binding protein